MINASISILLSLAGIACLYGSWRRASPKRPWTTVAGWLLLVVSTGFWVATSGAEFGVTFSLLAAGVIAWLMVLFNYEARQQKQREKSAGELIVPDAKTVSRHLLLFVVAVPLAGGAAILASTALTLALAWRPVNEMVFAVLIMPMLWGVASWWACADPRIFRPLLVLSTCAALSALLIFV